MVAAADLRKLIRRTIFATDVESTRYALGGVLVELTAESITMVGTDGRRLARMSAPAEAENGAASPDRQPGHPGQGAEADRAEPRRRRPAGPPGHPVGRPPSWSGPSGAVIYSRLVEGRFPRYQDVFPANVEVKIPLEAGPLRLAVEQASIVTSEESRGRRLPVRRRRRSSSPARRPTSAARTSSCRSHYEGKAVEITFDPRYLADALKTLDDTAAITAELIDSKNAAVFKTDDRLHLRRDAPDPRPLSGPPRDRDGR